MNNNLNFEAVKGYHINLRKLNNDQTKFITENLIKDYRDFEGDNNLFHYGYSAPNNEYRFFSFTCFSLGRESEEISFDEYINKLNIPKPEYDPKDVAFKNEVYSNSEFNSESKVIGYKLIKEEYKEAVKSLIKDDEWFNQYFDLFDSEKKFNFAYAPNVSRKGTPSVNKILNDAGVMHWFEPVFEEKKIKLTSGIELTEKDIEEVKEILKNK